MENPSINDGVNDLVDTTFEALDTAIRRFDHLSEDERNTDKAVSKAVRKLLTQGKDAKDRKGRNIWLYVANHNDWTLYLTEKILEVHPNEPALIDLIGACVDEANLSGRTFLQSCARNSTANALALVLLNKGTLSSSVDLAEPFTEQTPLHLAAWSGNTVLVEGLLQHGAKTDNRCQFKEDENVSPLHMACWSGFEGVVELLLEAGADPSACTDTFMTPLHIAASLGYCSIVKSLLAHSGSSIANAVCVGDWSPLHLACSNGRPTQARRLPIGKQPVGTVPPRTAVKVDAVGVVKALLSSDAQVNQKGDSSKTALHLAAGRGYGDIIRVLLAKDDIHITAKDDEGGTALLEAVQSYLNLQKKSPAPHDLVTHRDLEGLLHVVNLLTPWTEQAKQSLPKDATTIASDSDASVIDFGSGQTHKYRVSVFQLLYQHTTIPGQVGDTGVSMRPKPGSSLRWIHFPVNNTSWFYTLLVRWFFNVGMRDVETFKAFLRSLSQQQYEGMTIHSVHMRPTAKRIVTSTGEMAAYLYMPFLELDERQDHRSAKNPEGDGLHKEDDQTSFPKVPAQNKTKLDTSAKVKARLHTLAKGKAREHTPVGAETYRKALAKEIKRAALAKERIERGKAAQSYGRHHELGINEYYPHIRRTLDQFWYKDVNTDKRDGCQAQVVSRSLENYHTREMTAKQRGKREPENKMLVVDQLWIWTLGPGLIITAFPQTEQGLSSHLLTTILDKLNPDTGNPAQSVGELANVIVEQCLLACDRSTRRECKMGYLDVFNQYAAMAMDAQIELLHNLKEAGKAASTWMKGSAPKRATKAGQRSIDADSEIASSLPTTSDESEEAEDEAPKDELGFVDDLLDNNEEIECLLDVRDINDELNILSHLLSDQRSVLEKMTKEPWTGQSNLKNRLPGAEGQVSFPKDQGTGPGDLRKPRLSAPKSQPSSPEETPSASIPEGQPSVSRDHQPSGSEDLSYPQSYVPQSQPSTSKDQLSASQDQTSTSKDQPPGSEDQSLDSEGHSEDSCGLEDRKQDLIIKEQEASDMVKWVKGIDRSLTDLLDHKQRYANAIEARFARKQSESAEATGRTVMVFTLVTIIFLPLSFFAAFFAISIKELPHSDGPSGTDGRPGRPGEGDQEMSLVFIMRYVFGVGLGVAAVFILLAWNVGLAITFWQRWSWRWVTLLWKAAVWRYVMRSWRRFREAWVKPYWNKRIWRPLKDWATGFEKRINEEVKDGGKTSKVSGTTSARSTSYIPRRRKKSGTDEEFNVGE